VTTDTKKLIADLNDAVRAKIQTPPAPIAAQRAPKDWKPGVKYDGRGQVSEITTVAIPGDQLAAEDYQRVVEEMGVTVPAGLVLVLAEASFDPFAWTREEPFWIDEKGHQRKTPATTQAGWRYRFKTASAALVAASDEDLEKLQAAARRAVRARPRTTPFDGVTQVIVLGDIQAGKVDRRGGSAELLVRLEHALAEILRHVKRTKPNEILLIDGGDGMEMFESSPGADRTNDLSQTEQIRLWRRVLMSWVRELAKVGVTVKVISVPSNHCSVRRGKQNMGTPADDYGIEVLTQVADICAENPDAYGHVEFYSPGEHEEALAITLAGGKTLGVAHGHQKTRPEAIPAYLAGQAAGRTPIGDCDIAVFGHWHNLRVQTWGDDRWFFIAPTMDSGSSWFANNTGTESAPGVLTFVVDSRGWRDMHVAWAREGIDYETLEA
jgi:hypothetical protein